MSMATALQSQIECSLFHNQQAPMRCCHQPDAADNDFTTLLQTDWITEEIKNIQSGVRSEIQLDPDLAR